MRLKLIGYIILAFSTLSSSKLWAQDELLNDLLGSDSFNRTTYCKATFKSTRLINGHTIENVGPGVLDLRIAHRFGLLSGENNFLGLDQAVMRIGLDYGINHRLMVGVGRSTQEKAIDGFLKYRLMKQTDAGGKKVIPISMTLIAASDIYTTRWTDQNIQDNIARRTSYNFQLLLARKFSNSFSLQLMPTLTHKNLVNTAKDKNDIFSIGAGGRLKLTTRLALTAEYYYVLPNQIYSYDRTDAIAIGFDIETGGHVFQLMFTNASGMIERQFITQTQDKLKDWGIRFGFNLSRVFTVSEKATKRFKDQNTYCE